MKNNKGFTLIELLVGITVSAIIFLTAGSLIALLFRTDVRTKRVENFEQAKNDLQAGLTNSVRWAQEVSFTESTLTTDGTEYKLSNSRLMKDNQPLTPQNIKVKSFKIEDFSNNDELKSLAIQIEMESTQTATSQDSMKLVVSQRKTVITNE